MGTGRLLGWSRRRVAGLPAAAALAAAVPLGALAYGAPKVAGNPQAGRQTFISTCGVCHTLKAAATVGTVGPNLDRVRLTQAQLVQAVTNGGASIMSKAAVARYSTHMTPYRNALTKTQIQNVAAFVYASTHR